MDISTIAGIAGGFGLIIFGITISGDISSYFEITSVLIVFGGTMAATLASFPMSQFKLLLKIIPKAFKKQEINLNEDLEMIINMAQVARREGLLALEDAVDGIDNSFLQKGGRLLVDGCDPELIKSIMESELDFLQERHAKGRVILETMAGYAPAFGMIGTLIGLINMLKNLSDAATLGPSMAVAMITTFYGVMIANLICSPLAKKLKAQTAQEYYQKQMILEGLLAIQDGENPRMIREKLNSFIPPAELEESGSEESVDNENKET